MYRVRFTVQGLGGFPLDMLRYDCCFPRNSVDAATITRSLDDGGPVGGQEVELVRYFALRPVGGPITTGRWRSFGWTVTEQSNPEKV